MTKMITSISPAEEASLAVEAQKWIKIAFRTTPIEPHIITSAIRSLYEVAKLNKPRVIVVGSPRLMVFAHATASVLLKKHRIKSAVATQAHNDIIYMTVRDAVYATLDGLVPQKVLEALSDNPDPKQACLDIAGKAGLDEARNWSSNTQGGNANAAWVGTIAAYRDVLHLDIPELKQFAPYEQAAIEGSYRIMHEDFCMVSDFQMAIHINENNKPHNADGPSHQWRDGWKLYNWNGEPVPAHWIDNKASLTAKEVLKQSNGNKIRAGLEIINWEEVFDKGNSKVIDTDAEYGDLYKVTKVKEVAMASLFLRTQQGWVEVPDELSSPTGTPITTSFEAASAIALAKLTPKEEN
jgi:hypothetical protein